MPLLRGRGAVDLDAGGFDEQPVGHILGPGRGAEDILPDVPFGPAREAVVERFLGALERRGGAPPSAPFAGHEGSSRQNPAVIVPLHAACAGWQQRLDPRRLGI